MKSTDTFATEIIAIIRDLAREGTFPPETSKIELGARQESPHPHTCRSSVRYWIASLRCVESTFSAPAKSAIVRETLRIRS